MLKSLLIALFSIIVFIPFFLMASIMFDFSGGGWLGWCSAIGTMANWAVATFMIATA